MRIEGLPERIERPHAMTCELRQKASAHLLDAFRHRGRVAGVSGECAVELVNQVEQLHEQLEALLLHLSESVLLEAGTRSLELVERCDDVVVLQAGSGHLL